MTNSIAKASSSGSIGRLSVYEMWVMGFEEIVKRGNESERAMGP